MSSPRDVPALDVVVTEPVMSRFADVLTRGGTSPHRWTFAGDVDDDARAAAHVLVCASTTEAELASMPNLRLIHVTGAGVDKVPVAALGGTALANTFHHGRSIAEHVVMVAMMLRRDVLRSEHDVRDGVWRNAIVDPDYPFGRVLRGAVLAVVGFGEIGSEVARLGLALGMSVRAVRRDPTVTSPAGLEDVHVVGEADLHDALAVADVVVVTVPLSDATRGLIGAAELAAMREDAVLVNVARGPVVDERALHDALSAGTIGGAGIDVWWRNPREPQNPPPSTLDFTTFGNVVLTPHQSGHTDETFRGRAQDITDNVDALAEGRPLRNLVHL